MKYLNKLLFALLSMFALSSHAQNSNNPWAISFGVNAVDTRSGAGGGKNVLDSHFSQAFLVGQNWNILPSISYVSLARLIGSNLSVGLQGSVNKMDKFVVFDPSNTDSNSLGYVAKNPGNLMYYAIGANLKYSFMSLIKSKIIDPSLTLGGSYNRLGDVGFVTPSMGAGLTFWFSENLGLQLATVYKVSQLLGADRSDPNDGYTPHAPSHYQHTAGIVVQFGGKDTDGDGIYDKEDACPDVSGLKQFNGCPDTDADGIIDGSDACPTEFGLTALSGCPDKDGDGIADKDDFCPDTAGLANFRGCPDTDGDGLADKDDKCPTEYGLKSNEGCPILDADNDGVNDKEDDCPTVAGSVSNKGCPEVVEQIIENLTIEDKTILFKSGKSSFNNGGNSQFVNLDKILNYLNSNPNTKFTIEGHADSDGSGAFNQKLSEDRANAVRNALIEKGAKAENLTAVGFSETKPIATNKTKEGKAKNRRAEIKP